MRARVLGAHRRVGNPGGGVGREEVDRVFRAEVSRDARTAPANPRVGICRPRRRFVRGRTVAVRRGAVGTVGVLATSDRPRSRSRLRHRGASSDPRRSFRRRARREGRAGPGSDCLSAPPHTRRAARGRPCAALITTERTTSLIGDRPVVRHALEAYAPFRIGRQAAARASVQTSSGRRRLSETAAHPRSTNGSTSAWSPFEPRARRRRSRSGARRRVLAAGAVRGERGAVAGGGRPHAKSFATSSVGSRTSRAPAIGVAVEGAVPNLPVGAERELLARGADRAVVELDLGEARELDGARRDRHRREERACRMLRARRPPPVRARGSRPRALASARARAPSRTRRG
jgi:hypothetical protein